jgi:hypothetical protein
MIPVSSSRFTEWGWQPTNETQDLGNLFVVFKDGQSGYYQDVPLDVFREGRDSAPSKGSWLHTRIIEQGYPFYRMPPPGTTDNQPSGPSVPEPEGIS